MGWLWRCLGWSFNLSVSLETAALPKSPSVCPSPVSGGSQRQS
ncbi:rCG59668 [Rattus norvegicus]|uniref:RCG59668 n=1 Tax=Rattus norvegicus TaxID=10116 RepID=A6HSU5_RAT|nr:rCG59668 [Rattus norvegicus]